MNDKTLLNLAAERAAGTTWEFYQAASAAGIELETDDLCGCCLWVGRPGGPCPGWPRGAMILAGKIIL